MRATLFPQTLITQWQHWQNIIYQKNEIHSCTSVKTSKLKLFASFAFQVSSDMVIFHNFHYAIFYQIHSDKEYEEEYLDCRQTKYNKITENM